MLKTILHLAEPDSFTLRWVRSHSKAFERVLLVCFSEDKSKIQDSDYKLRNVEIHYLKFKRPLGYILNYLQLQLIVMKHKPTIIHVHYASGMGLLGALIKTSSYKILSILGSDITIFPKKDFLHALIIKFNLRRYNLLVHTSLFLKNYIKYYNGGRDQNLVHIPLGIPRNFKHPRQSTNEFNINIIKRVDYIYGIDIALRAFKLLLDWVTENNLPKVPKLNIYGGGKDFKTFIKMSESLSISKNVNFKGRISNSLVPEVLSKGSVSLNLSRSESFGVFILESQYCGCPVIASNVGGIPEVLKENVGGFIVPTEDYKTVFLKLKELYSDQNLLNRLSKDGQHFVENNFIWENSTLKPYMKILNSLRL